MDKNIFKETIFQIKNTIQNTVNYWADIWNLAQNLQRKLLGIKEKIEIRGKMKKRGNFILCAINK